MIYKKLYEIYMQWTVILGILENFPSIGWKHNIQSEFTLILKSLVTRYYVFWKKKTVKIVRMLTEIIIGSSILSFWAQQLWRKKLWWFFFLKTIPSTLGRCWKQWFSCQQIMLLLLSDIHGGGAARGWWLAYCKGAAVLSHFSLIHLTAAAAWYSQQQWCAEI